MECEGTSQRADGFRSEDTTWRVTISALQAEDAAFKPLVGLHRNTCQRLQISGFFLLFSFFFWGGGEGFGWKTFQCSGQATFQDLSITYVITNESHWNTFLWGFPFQPCHSCEIAKSWNIHRLQDWAAVSFLRRFSYGCDVWCQVTAGFYLKPEWLPESCLAQALFRGTIK